MNRVPNSAKVGLACALLCLLSAGGVAGWLMVQHNATHGDTRRPAASEEAGAEALAALPAARVASASDQAIARWKAKLQINERDPYAWADLGDALMQKARETLDASYYSHAEKAYGRALDLDARNVTATTGAAWVYGCRHEFEKSIEWANRALTLDPSNHAALGLLGDADVEMGDYESALDRYQKMLDLRPDLSSYSRGAHLLFLTGNVRKASLLMAKAIEAGGPYAENTAWCRAQLALMHFQTGNLAGSEQVLEDALARQPNNFHLLSAAGRVKAARKDYAGAVACYEKASAVVPQHEVLVALGDLYQLQGRAEEAKQQYALVESIHQLNKSLGIRGDVQMAQFYADHDRNLPEALKIAEEEYKTRKNVFVADTLAWCYYKNGRYEDARRLIKKALAQRTPDARILFHAGMIDARLADRAGAQLHLYQALSLNPHFHPADAETAANLLLELGSKPPDSTSSGTP